MVQTARAQAFEYQLLRRQEFNSLTADVIEVRRMLIGFVKKVRADIQRSTSSGTRTLPKCRTNAGQGDTNLSAGS